MQCESGTDQTRHAWRSRSLYGSLRCHVRWLSTISTSPASTLNRGAATRDHKPQTAEHTLSHHRNETGARVGLVVRVRYCEYPEALPSVNLVRKPDRMRLVTNSNATGEVGACVRVCSLTSCCRIDRILERLNHCLCAPTTHTRTHTHSPGSYSIRIRTMLIIATLLRSYAVDHSIHRGVY